MTDHPYIKMTTGLLTIIGAVFAVFFFMDDRHAHADNVESLRQYTVYSIKELELEAVTSKLEIFLAIPVDERRDWQKREIERLEFRIKIMQRKMKMDEQHKEVQDADSN